MNKFCILKEGDVVQIIALGKVFHKAGIKLVWVVNCMNGTNVYCGVHAEGNELSTRSRLGYVLKVAQAGSSVYNKYYVPINVFATPPSRGHIGA